MRVSIVSLLLAGGLLAAGGAMAQSTSEVQGTANIHIGQTAALDRSLNRTLPRPRASSAFRSCEDTAASILAGPETPPAQAQNRCQGNLGFIPRENQRQHRNAAINRSLNSGLTHGQ